MKFLKSDRGDSNLVTTVILVPLLLVVLITIIDSGLYFGSKSQMSNIAREGARTVAIFGGNGTPDLATPIEHKYGVDRTVVCKDVENKVNIKRVANLGDDLKRRITSYSAVECGMLKAVGESTGFIKTEVQDVRCSPVFSNRINTTASCKIYWTYSPFPLSLWGIVGRSDTWEEDTPPLANNVSTGTAQTEVDLSGQTLVPRW